MMRVNDDENLARRILVVGVGNRHRGDDGIGPVLVDWVEERAPGHIETFAVQGDLSDLVMRWNAETDVFVVDAMVSGRPAGTVLKIDALDGFGPGDPTPISTHGIGLAETIELARLLDRLPRSLTILAVEVGSLDHMAPLSPGVRSALPRLMREILSAQPSSRSTAADPTMARRTGRNRGRG